MNRIGPCECPRQVDADRIFLTAEWQHLVMLNYEVDAGLLVPFVPAGTELDDWKDKIFVSLVGFLFLNTKLLGFLPIPMHSNFEEVNLRFYVRRHTGAKSEEEWYLSVRLFRSERLRS
jgi:uncharacterized protein YqjF (DUF2071 family)